MQTVQVEINELLLAELDHAAHSLAMTRESFISTALQRALRQQSAIKRETQHAQGYARQPQTAEEVAEWLPEQDWEAI